MRSQDGVDPDDEERIEGRDPAKVLLRDEADRSGELLQRAREVLWCAGENGRAAVGRELAADREAPRQGLADEIQDGCRQDVRKDQEEQEQSDGFLPSGRARSRRRAETRPLS
jgi:hypothetical protein